MRKKRRKKKKWGEMGKKGTGEEKKTGGGGGGNLEKIRVTGVEPGTFSLEDHYFDHQAIIFQAFFFSYGNLISFFLTRGTTISKCF